MKDRLVPMRIFLALTVVLALFAACTPAGDFDESDLYGKWYCADMGLYYTFNSSGSGRYEDANHDGKNFSWTLDGERLEIEVHGDGINVTAFETYILTMLEDDVMKCYEQGFSSTTYTFTRQ